MKGLTHIFFDLDHTLWDYDYNSRKVLCDIYRHFSLGKLLTVSEDGFLHSFKRVNSTLWHQYNLGKTERDRIRLDRFINVLESCGGTHSNGLAIEISAYFLHHCPRQTGVMEDAESTLFYLQSRYGMSIVTNGFDDVQSIKLKSSRLDRFFPNVFTSESTGYKKPDPRMFHAALDRLALKQKEVIMIGDNPNTDILGAQNAGITPVLYNPSGKVRSTCELQVNSLRDLMKIL